MSEEMMMMMMEENKCIKMYFMLDFNVRHNHKCVCARACVCEEVGIGSVRAVPNILQALGQG